MIENLTREQEIKILIEQIDVCANEVIDEHANAPTSGRAGLEAVSRLKKLLGLKEENPYRHNAEESDVDYYKRIKENIEDYRNEHPR